MTYCCRLPEGRFSPYLACFKRLTPQFLNPRGKNTIKFPDAMIKTVCICLRAMKHMPRTSENQEERPIATAGGSWAEALTAVSGGSLIRDTSYLGTPCCTTHWSCWDCVCMSRDEISTSLALTKKSFHKDVKTWRAEENPVASQADFVWVTLYILAHSLLQTVCTPCAVQATTWVPWCHWSAKLSVITCVSNNNRQVFNNT